MRRRLALLLVLALAGGVGATETVVRCTAQSQMTCLDGRPGGQTLSGGTAAGDSLLLRSSSSGSTHTGTLQTRDQLRLRTDVSSLTASDTIPILANWNGAVSIDATGVVFGVLGTQGTITCNTDDSGVDATVIRNKWEFLVTSNGKSWPGMNAFSNNPKFTTSATAAGGATNHAFQNYPVFETTGAGVLGGAKDIGFDDIVTLSGNVSNITKYGYHGIVGTSGGAALGEYRGIYIEDFPATGTNLAYHSVGGQHGFIHGGVMKVGASSDTLASGIQLEIVGGHVLLRNTGTAQEVRWREPDASGSDYVSLKSPALAATTGYTFPNAFPAGSGQMLTSTTAGVMSWQAQSALTETGLIGTYNGMTTVDGGLASIVAKDDELAQTANVGVMAVYTTPATGFYRVSGYVVVTQAAASGGTMPGINLFWTDGTTGGAASLGSMTTVTSGNPAVSSIKQGTAVIYALTGTAISWSTGGYVAGTAPTLAYAARVRVEAL